MDAVVALIGKLAHQFLGVDEILRASHRNKINTILLHKNHLPHFSVITTAVWSFIIAV